jgi:hypothetical protein
LFLSAQRFKALNLSSGYKPRRGLWRDRRRGDSDLQAGLASGGCGAQPTFDPVKRAKGCGAEKFQNHLRAIGHYQKKKPLEENDAKVALGAHNNNAFTA